MRVKHVDDKLREVALERRLWLLRCGLAVAAGSLVLASWPLWFPGFSGSDFPLVPLWKPLLDAPRWIDSLLSGLLCLGLLLWFAPGSILSRCGVGLTLVIGLALVSLDQHRLQPWFYQLLVISALLLCGDQRFRWRAVTWLVISVYLYSAVGKFDFEFLHTVGQEFLIATGSVLGMGVEAWSEQQRLWGVTALPLFELLLGIGLVIPRTRTYAGWLACIFHLFLAGSFAFILQHSWGVILWNLQFAFQAIVLFGWPVLGLRSPNSGFNQTGHQRQPMPDEPAEAAGSQTSARLAASSEPVAGERWLPAWGGQIVLGLALLLPLGERWGWWDHWLSWALYAPHSSRVEVFVARTAVKQLPEGVRRVTQASSGDARTNTSPEDRPSELAKSLWVRIPIDRWSLQQTGTPIYPQARFQLGVARYLAQHFNSDFMARAELRGVANRFSGKRRNWQLRDRREIERADQRFWLNTEPRR